MDRKTIIGLAGAIILAVGVFLPIVSAPIVGNVNYFRNGKGDGTIVLALAIASVILALIKKHKWLLLTGIFSIALLSYTLYNMYSGIAASKTKMEADLADNPFKGLAELAAESIQLEWGWPVMFAGAILLIFAALVADAQATPTKIEGDGDHQSCLFCAERIKIEASVCRYCGKEQPADALPEEINCPACEEVIVLDSKERLEKKFVCAACGYRTGQTMLSEG